ncbi:cupin domain-containing protein [uncultured Megasphaera sp.]|uniref:cupin domain-containing protein n=1 Tax=uncultured Megasphaera sp. TaxID=165188 RepID=UPI002658ABA2|nr:cupin domain-containing protein [uncultured Megasphaera sp.]
MDTEKVEHAAGGKGYILKQKLLTEEQLMGKNGMFARITLKPGCSLGYHMHTGNAEAYYILSGEGEYDDNGAVRTVKAGDVTYTPDGKSHSLENKGTEDLVFIALIINN